MIKSAEQWINHLHLEQHPEGGFFSENYRSSVSVNLSNDGSLVRNLATSIYFLLPSGSVSKLHRLKSDEIWYFHEGSAVDIHVFFKENYLHYTLGNNFERGESLQVILPAGAIFGAEVIDPDSFSLMGCMVAPGFHFDDFELMTFDSVIKFYPAYNTIIRKLT